MSSFRPWLLALAACGYTPPAAGGDAPIPVGGEPPPPAADLHVLITEVCPFGGNAAAEFIEIYNPTTAPVDLSTYYLSDDPNYWKLPAALAQPPTATIVLADSDFLVKFPAGATIAPGQILVIATDADDYTADVGMQLDFAIVVGSASAPLLEPAIATPGNMAERLTNTGEMVALFQWDGTSDLVHDVDLVVPGTTVDASNSPKPKAPIDGPDADSTTTAYAPDALTIGTLTVEAANGMSYKRIALEGTHETHTGGNGITGHDETSEDERMTWEASSGVTPGIIPPALRP